MELVTILYNLPVFEIVETRRKSVTIRITTPGSEQILVMKDGEQFVFHSLQISAGRITGGGVK